jgi:tRNA (guanine37-N1)-methyltransferase
MSKELNCIKVTKRQGQKALVLATKLGIIDKEYNIRKDEGFLCVPLIGEPPEDILNTLKEEGLRYEISTRHFQQRRRQKASLAELIEERLPSHLLASLPHSMDLVGDIAILEIPPELDDHKRTIGKAILKANKNVRTVLAKASAVGGIYRLRKFDLLAGENKTETTHREFGCQYRVDLTKAYFSPRLSYEHKRVASVVKEGETVLDLFAGVGPFAILIASTHENVKAYAVDANPHAVEYLKTNIRLNRVNDKVRPFLGDARQVVCERISGTADRVIMNLPERAAEYVDVACLALKPDGGVVHFYSFVSVSNPSEMINQRFKEAVEKTGRRVGDVLSTRTIRETAPREWQAVLDVKIG